jgi:transposase
MRTHGSPQELERVRLIAANMFEQGMAPKPIASILGVDDQTVRRWRRVWNHDGRTTGGLLARKAPGSSPKLTDEQKHELLELLKREPATYGFVDAHLWTTKLMAKLIEQRFGVRHHHDHVGYLLRQLGWSVQRPARRAKERDETRIAQWRDEVWPALEKKVTTRTA